MLLILFLSLLFSVSAVPVPISTPEDCSMCKFVSDLSDIYLRYNFSEGRTYSQIWGACQNLDRNRQDSCFGIMYNSMTKIFGYLKNGYSPSEICRMLSYCNNLEKKKISSCFFCEEVVQRLENKILENNTLDYIRTLAMDACSELGPYKVPCIIFTETYLVPDIKKFIGNESPNKICKQMSFCH